jgi:transcriptional regulator with PAS, ATPase and Fis domain
LGEALRDAAAASQGGPIDASHLAFSFRVPLRPPARRAPSLGDVLEQVERRMILDALRKARDNKSEAAEALGIPRGRLLRRVAALRLEPTE